jgi:hypothetical protein
LDVLGCSFLAANPTEGFFRWPFTAQQALAQYKLDDGAIDPTLSIIRRFQCLKAVSGNIGFHSE